MNRFKFTISVIMASCLFLLACATQVSANTSVLTTSTTATPNLQQHMLMQLRSNPNLKLTNLQVHIVDNKAQLAGYAETGFQRALAQKFVESTDGLIGIENKIQVKAQNTQLN